jgi:hypothetical protein
MCHDGNTSGNVYKLFAVSVVGAIPFINNIRPG